MPRSSVTCVFIASCGRKMTSEEYTEIAANTQRSSMDLLSHRSARPEVCGTCVMTDRHRALQPGLQIYDQIVRRFDAHRQTQQRVRNARHAARFRVHGCVRHRRWMCDRDSRRRPATRRERSNAAHRRRRAHWLFRPAVRNSASRQSRSVGSPQAHAGDGTTDPDSACERRQDDRSAGARSAPRSRHAPAIARAVCVRRATSDSCRRASL